MFWLVSQLPINLHTVNKRLWLESSCSFQQGLREFARVWICFGRIPLVEQEWSPGSKKWQRDNQNPLLFQRNMTRFLGTVKQLPQHALRRCIKTRMATSMSTMSADHLLILLLNKAFAHISKKSSIFNIGATFAASVIWGILAHWPLKVTSIVDSCSEWTTLCCRRREWGSRSMWLNENEAHIVSVMWTIFAKPFLKNRGSRPLLLEF